MTWIIQQRLDAFPLITISNSCHFFTIPAAAAGGGAAAAAAAVEKWWKNDAVNSAARRGGRRPTHCDIGRQLRIEPTSSLRTCARSHFHLCQRNAGTINQSKKIQNKTTQTCSPFCKFLLAFRQVCTLQSTAMHCNPLQFISNEQIFNYQLSIINYQLSIMKWEQ